MVLTDDRSCKEFEAIASPALPQSTSTPFFPYTLGD